MADAYCSSEAAAMFGPALPSNIGLLRQSMAARPQVRPWPFALNHLCIIYPVALSSYTTLIKIASTLRTVWRPSMYTFLSSGILVANIFVISACERMAGGSTCTCRRVLLLTSRDDDDDRPTTLSDRHKSSPTNKQVPSCTRALVVSHNIY